MPFQRAGRVEQLIRLQACGWACERWVALVQERAAEQAQAAGRPFQQLSNDRLGGRVPGRGVQLALDDDGGRFVGHGRGLKDQGGAGHLMHFLVHPVGPRNSVGRDAGLAWITGRITAHQGDSS